MTADNLTIVDLMSDQSPNILIIKYRALGDSVMGLSTISYLRSIYPNSKIYYGIRSWTTALYESSKTDADEIISLDFETVSSTLKTLKKISSLKIDHIHELHQSGRTKKVLKPYCFFSGVKYTAHNHHLKSGGDVLDQGVIKSLIQRDLDGAYSFLGKDEVPSFLNFAPKITLESNTKINSVVFGVVATRETKMWPLQYYVGLANQIKDEFPDYKFIVPLSKSSQDQEIKEKLKAFDKKGLLEFVELPLKEIPELLSKAKLYIGNDTGLKHIAISVGTKSFTFFGPEPPNEWHPYNKEEHPYFFIDPLECRTREAHYCGLHQCDSMICLNDIEVAKVFNSIKADL